jgi:hypothetical protein
MSFALQTCTLFNRHPAPWQDWAGTGFSRLSDRYRITGFGALVAIFFHLQNMA